MFTIPGAKTSKYCDGRSRRDFLQVGMAGMGALGLSHFLRAKAAAAKESTGKQTSAILLWLDGGPSQHDTYDPKPEAPPEYRGIWSPIATKAPGMHISEMFPLQSKVADKFSIIRSMHHNAGDHFTGGHWMLTGRGAGVSGANKFGRYPFFGALATKMTGSRQPGIPAHVAVPHAMSIGIRPGYFGGNYLGVEHNPFDVGSDPNRANFSVQNINVAKGVSIDRLDDRRNLLSHFDNLRRTADTSGAMDALDEFDQKAFEMVTGERARKAFDMATADEKLRDRYGRNSWGQSTLLARRLVEAGSTFVTCHFGGWDSHWNHQARMETTLPQIDQLVSALLEDLSQRGMLETTMVMLMGEFGRTPKMNDGGNGGPPMSKGTPGRDHWGNSLSVMVAGGGIQGGRVIGSTNRLGESPLDQPLRPGDLHHTVFHVLGVDPKRHFNNLAGRPIIAIEEGDVIHDLF